MPNYVESTSRKHQLYGKRFDRLEVIRGVSTEKGFRWECRCDCGNITYQVSVALTTGHTSSCGCKYLEYKHSDDTKDRLRIASTGRKFSPESNAINSASKKGIINIGSKNGQWRGGTTAVSLKIKGFPAYRKWRKYCIQRDQHTCQKCLKSSVNDEDVRLEVHHLISFGYIIRYLDIRDAREILKYNWVFDPCHGVTLCHECHMDTDTYGPKATKMIEKELLSNRD